MPRGLPGGGGMGGFGIDRYISCSLLFHLGVGSEFPRRCGSCLLTQAKGLGKRGHIVADTLLPTQMFPRLPARATLVATKILCP